MDTLPVELLRLIFTFCDPPSVRNLRLITPTLADVGYDYLLPSIFTALPWRDDLTRLRAIARHSRLRSSIETIVFGCGDLSSYEHTCGRQRVSQAPSPAVSPPESSAPSSAPSGPPSPRSTAAASCIANCRLCEACLHAVSPAVCQSLPLHALDPVDVATVLRPLTNLRHLAVTFMPIDCDGSSPDSYALSPTLNHGAACKTTTVLMSALQAVARDTATAPQTQPPALEAFAIQGVPLELFRQPAARRELFQTAPAVFGAASMTRLDLVLDWTNVAFPASQFKAMNGLGYVLRLAMPHLKHLSLSFRRAAPAPSRTGAVTPTYASGGGVGDMHMAGAGLVGGTVSASQPPSRLPSPHRPGRRDRFLLSFGELLGETIGGGSPPSSGGGGSGGGWPGAQHDLHVAAQRQPSCWTALTDLTLDGISCDERTLRAFLLRHAGTLERVRFGRSQSSELLHAGGCASAASVPGITLYNGTFGTLCSRLRGGRLPRLQSLTFEGEFLSDASGLGGGPAIAQSMTAAASTAAFVAPQELGLDPGGGQVERPWFRAVADGSGGASEDNEAILEGGSSDSMAFVPDSHVRHVRQRTVESRAFEEYVLGVTGVYPAVM